MMAEGRFFGADQFNPRLITTQIIVMQSSFWFCLGAAVAFADWLLSEEQSAAQLFQPEAYTWNTRRGLILALALWFTSLVMAVELRFVVQRAKKCLDFVTTYHLFHLLATFLAEGFPANMEWWIIQLPALFVAVLLGEYLCMQAETQDIKLYKKPKVSRPSFDEI
ncbi:SYS1 [Symbiodinium natans]|uniref:SYS1 protein n=1 Tax=Symbiodinium natans TaxID=878477 RepID=A0A812QGX8_9DINO|nr:SYS1 [Symbiodinium natans]